MVNCTGDGCWTYMENIVKWILKIPPHLACCYTIPCRETLMSANQAINDKLQDSVATYLRCSEVVNNQIKKGSDMTELWS